jgi:hypothetical protein
MNGAYNAPVVSAEFAPRLRSPVMRNWANPGGEQRLLHIVPHRFHDVTTENRRLNFVVIYGDKGTEFFTH